MSKETKSDKEFDILEPEVYKPRTLPLLVQPAGGIDVTKPFNGWKNQRQMDFAKIVSQYGYQNPTKWNYRPVREMNGVPVETDLPTKKERLIAKLSALGNLPDLPENPDAPKLKVNGSKVGI